MPGALVRTLAVLILGSAVSLAAQPRAQPQVTGTVSFPSGQPLAGARAELRPVLSNHEAGRLRLAGQPDPAPVATAVSDAAGRFALQAPAPGVFKVVVRGGGRVPMQSPPLLLAEDQELAPVDLAGDSPVRLRVADAAGRPVAGAWVFAVSVDQETGLRASAWRPDFRLGRTGADGTLALARLATERLDVTVFPPGSAEVTRRGAEGQETVTISLPAEAGRTHALQVVSPGGAPVAGVLVRGGDLAWPLGLTDAAGRLRFPRGSGSGGRLRLIAPDGRQQAAPLSPDSTQTIVLAEASTVAGRVTDAATSQPLAGALVSPGLDPGAFQLTDAGGRYRLTVPDPQEFLVSAGAPRRLTRTARVTGPQIRSGRTPTLALTPAVVVRGVVVDPQGAPLSGVRLAASSDSEAAVSHGATDAAGRFELRPLRPGGFYEVHATRPGALPASVRTVTPAPSGQAPPLRIVLSPARPARGLVKDAAGRPVAGVAVRLSPSAPAGAPPSAGPQRSAESAEKDDPFLARTDPQGRFAIPQVPADRVDLTARLRGYAPATVRGLRIPPGPGAADLGTVVLRPGGRVSGRVLDRQGRPVSGAEIHLVDSAAPPEQQSARLKDEKPDATSGGDGTFSLEDLPQRTPLHLLVRAAGYLPAGVRGVRVPAPQPLTVRLEAGALLRGRVVDAEAQPVQGARVDFTWQATAPENPERTVGRPTYRSAVSGSDGRFEIRDAPAGTGSLDVNAQGFVPVEEMKVPVPWPESRQELTIALDRGASLSGRISTSAADPVAGARVVAQGAHTTSDDEGAYLLAGVAPGPAVVEVIHPAHRRFFQETTIAPGVNQLDLTLEAGPEVAGRVVDEQGEGVPGALVRLVALADRQSFRARAGVDGAFRFESVPRGRYLVQAEGEGHATAELPRPLTVAREAIAGVEIVLRPGGAITGRVLGLAPEDLARVRVGARDEQDREEPATLDAEGRYEIRRLRPGDYLVTASLADGQRQARARVALRSTDREVVRDLEFDRRLTLSGQVLTGEEPLPEAQVALRGQRHAIERTLTTDYQGSFRFEDLEPDTYWIGILHSREQLVHNDSFELATDREVTIRLRTATVSGVVKSGQSGEPVAKGLVLFHHAAGEEGPEYLVTGGTDPDGRFLLTKVQPGTYRLTAQAGGYSPTEQTVVVPAGQDVEGLEVALTPTQGLELNVRLASGKIPPLVQVRVAGPGGQAVVTDSRSPDASGKVSFPTVPEGSWTLAVSGMGGAVLALPVSVPGEPVPVTLPAAGRLHVRVEPLVTSDLTGTLTLQGANQQPFWTLGPGGELQLQWPVIAGKATVEGIPAGVWQLRIDAADGRSWTGTAATAGGGEVSVGVE